MRLIDVEQCPCDKCKRCNYAHPSYCHSFEGWANKTAYDVDNVVDELIIAWYPLPVFDIDNCEIEESLLKAEMVEDIVRRGGIHDGSN